MWQNFDKVFDAVAPWIFLIALIVGTALFFSSIVGAVVGYIKGRIRIRR